MAPHTDPAQDSAPADAPAPAPAGGADERAVIAQMIDHTLLAPEATAQDVAALIAEAHALGVKAVCVSPTMLPLSGAEGLVVAAVCGFPSGKHRSEIKAAEAACAVAEGAAEIDMVIDVGAAVAGEFQAVEDDIRAVVQASGAALVKVIIESAALTDEQILEVCRRAEIAGADYVKTSTGFHPAGGASAHAVALMRAAVGDRLGVKASGGIRSAAAARQMIAAGASRLGLSGSRAVLDGLAGPAEPGAAADSAHGEVESSGGAGADQGAY